MRQRDGSDVLGHVERMFPCVNHEESLKFQVCHCGPHRGRNGWGGRSLNFKAPPLSTANNEQVEFRPAVCSPKVSLIVVDLKMLHHLMDDETFP
jgi:hypothetical protein